MYIQGEIHTKHHQRGSVNKYVMMSERERERERERESERESGIM